MCLVERRSVALKTCCEFRQEFGHFVCDLWGGLIVVNLNLIVLLLLFIVGF